VLDCLQCTASAVAPCWIGRCNAQKEIRQGRPERLNRMQSRGIRRLRDAMRPGSAPSASRLRRKPTPGIPSPEPIDTCVAGRYLWAPPTGVWVRAILDPQSVTDPIPPPIIGWSGADTPTTSALWSCPQSRAGIPRSRPARSASCRNRGRSGHQTAAGTAHLDICSRGCGQSPASRRIVHDSDGSLLDSCIRAFCVTDPV